MPSPDFISISIFIFSYPDVMMPAYAKSRFYSIFYIAYLSLELYFIMNLVSELQTGYLIIVMDMNRNIFIVDIFILYVCSLCNIA